MAYVVIKLGGSVCAGPSSAPTLARIVAQHRGRSVFVLSALKGVTDRLIAFAAEPPSEPRAAAFVAELKGEYLAFARAFEAPVAAAAELEARLDAGFGELLACALGSAADRAERIASFGERLSALAFCAAIAADDARAAREPGARSRRRPSSRTPCAFPEELGLAAEGADPSDADCPDPGAAGPALKRALRAHGRLAVPGFYGVSRGGAVALFGRGGSDYSAVALAAAAGARLCVLYKDATGICSADPSLVDGVRRVPRLSYGEASALSAAGAKVLHPRTAALAERHGVALAVRPADGAGVSYVAPAKPRRSGPIAISLDRERSEPGRGVRTVALIGEGVATASACAVKAIKELERLGIAPRSLRFDPAGSALCVDVPAESGVAALRGLHGAFFPGRAV